MNCCKSSSGVVDNDTKLIAVMGATGAQGGAVVRAFDALKKSGYAGYRIRAITRDPTSEKAKAIAPLVDEVVKADGDDEESLVAAFEGCYGVFVLSNFWEDMDVKHEMQVLRNVKNALKKTEGVKHIVLSTLEDSRKFVANAENKDTWKVVKSSEELGMYVPHFDGKAEATEEYISEGLPITRFLISFYYENFINFGMGPTRQTDSDPYAITLPLGDIKLAAVAVADIGKAACAVFQDESLIGKTVGVASDFLTGQEIADIFTKVCGQTVVFNAVPSEVYASFGFPGADDLANMFRLKVENNEAYNGCRVVSDEMKERMGGLISLETWLTENKTAFPHAEEC
jgi:uncharacterized protein YbjT (DUF2867 family)